MHSTAISQPLPFLPAVGRPAPATAQARPALAVGLSATLAKVLQDWASLPSKSLPAPLADAPALELELSTVLSGSRDHALVLRCSRRLAADLAFANTGDPSARALGEQALDALCHRLASSLCRCCLSDGARGYTIFPAWRSCAQERPSVAPDEACLLEVQGEPLEAQLWALPLPALNASPLPLELPMKNARTQAPDRLYHLLHLTDLLGARKSRRGRIHYALRRLEAYLLMF